MKSKRLNKLAPLTILLWFSLLVLSCADNGNKIKQSDNVTRAADERYAIEATDASTLQSTKSSNKSKTNLTVKLDSMFKVKFDSITDYNYYYDDTVFVTSSAQLINSIKSNRVIKLVNRKYELPSSLIIDGINNLKIEGVTNAELSVIGKNKNTLTVQNSHTIHLDHLTIGHAEPLPSMYEGEQGALIINQAYNVLISHCQILGAGTFGFVTNAVNNLRFTQSRITSASALIFEIKKSANVRFEHAVFHDNQLAISVLGGFTEGSHDISFISCDFVDNIPKMPNNPTFNFYLNEAEKPVAFTECTFKNNKGFKWYGDQIILHNCQVDSSDFTF